MAHPACAKKLTERVNFGMALDGIPENLAPLAHDSTRKRQGIEEALKQVDGSSETVVNTLREYVVLNSTLKSILQQVKGFSRLRFKWSNFMDEDEKTVTNNVDEDMASMMLAAGIWHLEHAHLVNRSITNEEVDEEKMKQSLNSLKMAASIFETVKSWEGFVQGGKDLSAPILSALHLQSVAQGQSVTIRRAISKNHKASLISELCHDAAQKYTTAAGEVDTSHHEGQKWSTYLKFQGESYMALTRCYQGVHLLETEEKCGESIAVLDEGFKHLNQATHLAKEYDKIKPKTKLHLAESAPFEKIKKLLTEKKAKSERENGLIYHQKQPEECPPPPDPKCVVHVTALELETGEDLTRTVAESSDDKQPEGEGGEVATDAGKGDDSSPDSSTGRPPPLLRRHDTFGSAELFEAWAKDSFINQSTIDILVKTHQIDCLPAVLALKKEDYPQLNLPVGQRRLLEDAVEKLRQEYELARPPTPKAIINLEMPVYKSMLEIGELAEEETGASEMDNRGQLEEEVPVSRAQSGFVSQRKLGQASSFVDSGTEKRDIGPEKKALLDTEQRNLSPQTAQRRKDGEKSSPRQSQAYLDDGDNDGDEYTACACQRWMFVTIFMPIFVVLSILGFIFVLLLMPFRLCCPQGGVFTNVLTFLFEVFIMAPCLACKWASGKGKQPTNWTTGSKPRYGGTDDVELGDK